MRQPSCALSPSTEHAAGPALRQICHVESRVWSPARRVRACVRTPQSLVVDPSGPPRGRARRLADPPDAGRATEKESSLAFVHRQPNVDARSTALADRLRRSPRRRQDADERGSGRTSYVGHLTSIGALVLQSDLRGEGRPVRVGQQAGRRGGPSAAAATRRLKIAAPTPMRIMRPSGSSAPNSRRGSRYTSTR